MRLTPYEIASIQECAALHFGEGAVVRLFGSRVHDHLAGGDIDLHITTACDPGLSDKPKWRFKEELETRIGEQRIDVLVNGPAGPQRPIEEIAVLTGIVLPKSSSLGPVTPPPHIQRQLERREACHQMVDRPHSQVIRDAISSGQNAKAHIREALVELRPVLPVDAKAVAGFDRGRRLEAESLLLNFGNLVAVIQDQLIRAILIASNERVQGQSRLDHQHTAEKLGALPDGLPFQAMIDTRNTLAHQYPADPAKQADIINAVDSASATAIAAFDGLAAYAEAHVLRHHTNAGG